MDPPNQLVVEPDLLIQGSSELIVLCLEVPLAFEADFVQAIVTGNVGYFWNMELSDISWV